jgi:hypothetical protein
MSDDDVVLANQHPTKVTPARWAPLSLLAGLIAISALIDAVALIADIVRTSASLRQALQPVVASSAGPVIPPAAGGGTSNAEAMKSMGFDHFVRHWLMNMDIPLQLLLYVLVACWVYQAVYNVNVRGVTGVGKPGWVTTWFMMPVVNLVSPAFYMSKIWRASIDIRDWKQRSAPALLWIWWLAWVARLGSMRFKVDLNETLEREIHRYKIIIAEDLIWLLSLLLLVIVIYRVCQAQQRQFGH